MTIMTQQEICIWYMTQDEFQRKIVVNNTNL